MTQIQNISYLEILSELQQAILTNNIDSLKKLCKSISSVKNQATVKDNYDSTDNPIKCTNLVIFACKHNKHETLKYLFNNKSKILSQLSVDIGRKPFLPDDEDEACHNAFYYAIRSGNVDLLDTLISKWPNDYFLNHLEELDEILSRAYEELNLKNIPLSYQMEIFVEDKLINLRFYSNTCRQDQNVKKSFKNIRGRIELILQNITLLKTDYPSTKKVDEKFLFIAKFIARNIFVLKQQLKSTYDRLPWEEIELCLISFIFAHTKREEINLFYNAVLDKKKILNHLDNFANKLKNEKDVTEDAKTGTLTVLPKLKRVEVVAKIIESYPQFEELYNDYRQIRDIRSLEKISYYIKLALSSEPKKREGRLIIIRVLQIVGEYLKSTLESPKLSRTTSDLLLLSLPKNTREVIIILRNSLSHVYALSKRTEIEENTDVRFFIGIQNDIKKINNVITDILHKNKIKIIRILLKKIVDSESIDEVREVGKIFRNVDMHWDSMISSNSKLTEHEKLGKPIQKLSDYIIDKTNDEKELLYKINDIFNCVGTETISESSKTDYFLSFAILKNINIILKNEKVDHNTIRGIKFSANQSLQNITPKIEPNKLEEIAKLTIQISRSVNSRMKRELDEMNRITYEIFHIVEFGMSDFKWIEKFSQKLNENISFIPELKQRPSSNVKDKNYNNQLALKLSELKNILKYNALSDQLNEKLETYRNDKNLQAVVEMLVLDIMSILGSWHLLENNLLFIDDNTPLLTGRCLRNHLAHDNVLVEILSDPSISVILNAKKLTEEHIKQGEKKIGKLVPDDSFKLREKYIKELSIITNQERMFVALEEGNLESVIECLEKGADINAKNFNLWTTLHFAAKGHSLEIIKFILNQNVTVNAKNIDGNSPLHIAAAYGRKNIVEFFIKKVGLSVDSRNNNYKTPLHIAAQYGHKDTVEVLLKYKADIVTHDITGYSSLHCAIVNNHLNVAKILLKMDENVDINETMGGFTSLHAAAENGYLEIVNFLLQNKANVNARNDNNWIPLHGAALNGHLEVVNALIQKRADVNARVINGCTPLHYAVENGHEKIAKILLKHGANTDAVDKKYFNTPLHYAAKDGHEGIVQALLKNKANACVATVLGTTPLHFAAQSGHLVIVAALLKYGADICAIDKNSATPLHHAVESGHKKVVELLIENGAEINAKAHKNITPLYIAALEGHEDIVNHLIENQAGVHNRDLEGGTPLHAAAIKGSINVIRLLIKSRADIDARSYDDLTPLHAAALNGHTDAINFLIKNKADVNCRTTHGFTPLHAAAAEGHKDVLSLLIKNKAQVDTKCIAGSTPLHAAVIGGHKEIVEVLVENGANVNVKNKNQTPLLYAVRYKHKKIVELLLAKGANADAEHGEPLLAAAIAGYKDIVDILLKYKANINIKSLEDITPLHLAAMKGYKKIVNALITEGANVDATCINNVTPLYLAAENGHEEVVEILITSGANFNVMNVEGTPLHIAAGQGHDNVVEVLLNKEVNIKAKDNKNRTALELAVGNGHLRVVKLLLQYKKVDMNAKGNGGWTILHIASQKNNLQMVTYLVDKGCDINAKNASGSKPVHIAAREGYKDIVEFFLSKGSSINDPGAANQTLLHYAAIKSHLEVLEYLITKGVDVNVQDANGLTPLHIAAKFNHKDVIEVLLKNGAIYNPVDKFNRKPLNMTNDKNVINLLTSTEKLFEAVKCNNSVEVENCIKAGAFLNLQNANRETPLHYAAWKGYDEVVNVLLQSKANPNVVRDKGITPLHYAAKFSHLKIVKALLSNGAIYDAASETGKTPLDFVMDKCIASLLKLLSKSFKNAENNNCKLINDLNKIEDIGVIKAIMCAHDRQNRTLILAAMQNNFSKIEQLKQVGQGDIHTQVNIASLSLQQGDYQRASNIFQEAFEKRKEILGSDSPATLDIQIHLARSLYAQGAYQKALNALEDILRKQKDILGLNNKDTLHTRSFIALVLHRLEKNEESYDIFKEVYPKQQEILKPNDPDILDTQLHMALVLARLGKYEEALSINTALYEKRKKEFGANHHLVLVIQNNIAMVLCNQGKHGEALEIYKDVLKKKKAVLGISHTDTLRTLQSIAGILVDQKKYHEALKAYQEVLTIQKNVLGKNHPQTLDTIYYMGNVLFVQGKLIGAFKAYREILDQMKIIYGLNHSIVSDIKEKIKVINLKFRLGGSTESEIISHLQTDINIAASKGDIQTVQFLLKNGADVNDTDTEGRTALHFAVSNGHIDIVNVLLKYKSDITQVTNKSTTALHIAASKNYKDIVETLLQHVSHDKINGFINAKTTTSGATALHVAAKNGYSDVTKALLKRGAIYNIKNNEGDVPLKLSKDQNVTNLLKLVGELFEDAQKGTDGMIDKLRALETDEFIAVTNARNNLGKSFIQVAIANKHISVANQVLKMLKKTK